MSYTQNNEENLVLEYFKNRHSSAMCVLDCGANDGRTFSNSLRVIELGWQGALIEPSPKAFALLKETHKSNPLARCYPFAITKEDGVFELQESASILNQGDTSLVSSFKNEETEKWRNSGTQFTPVKIAGMTFDSFVKTFFYDTFNLISIDVEGLDYEVLSQIDLNKFGCEMLIVEFNGKDEQMFTDYVTQFGMKLLSKNPENLIFVK